MLNELENIHSVFFCACITDCCKGAPQMLCDSSLDGGIMNYFLSSFC